MSDKLIEDMSTKDLVKDFEDSQRRYTDAMNRMKRQLRNLEEGKEQLEFQIEQLKNDMEFVKSMKPKTKFHIFQKFAELLAHHLKTQVQEVSEPYRVSKDNIEYCLVELKGQKPFIVCFDFYSNRMWVVNSKTDKEAFKKNPKKYLKNIQETFLSPNIPLAIRQLKRMELI